MKFIKLESRGGNYLVVASNVAWLRTAENGQTNVGIVGGQPLLVVGSVEEVAAKILAGLAGTDDGAEQIVASPAQPPAQPEVDRPSVAATPSAEVAEPASTVVPATAASEDCEQEAEPIQPDASQPQKAAPALKPGAARPRVVSARSAAMWERPAAAVASVKIKAGSQRMMGRLD